MSYGIDLLEKKHNVNQNIDVHIQIENNPF